MSGKKLLLFLIVGLLIAVGLLFHFQGAAAWRLWNIPTMSIRFADAGNILFGVESARAGYDPLYQNPFDPFGRVIVYPRIWLLLGLLRLSSAQTDIFVVVETLLCLLGLFVFTDRLDRRAAVGIAAFLISPGVMLCFERGNPDLVAFFLLAAALAILPRMRVLSLLLIELAAFLKLYPAIALGVLLREPKKALTGWLAAALAVFMLYAAFFWRDIRHIFAVSPKGAGFNFGVEVASLWFFDLTGSRPLANVLLALSYLLVYAVTFYMLFRSYRDGPGLPVENLRSLDAFRVGALIYMGTFLQGNTWNYRLIFLIFAIPMLVSWARAGSSAGRNMAGAALVLAFGSAWLPILGASEPPSGSLLGVIQFILDELSNWGLFACLTYLFLASLPDWIREQVSLFFHKYRLSPPIAG